MMSIKSIATRLVAAATLLGAGSALAHNDFHDRPHWQHDRHGVSAQLQREINQRQHQQRERILAARERGRLTPHEFRSLMATHRDIKQMERRFLADGRLDRREYQQLDRALDRAGHEIRREARDGSRMNYAQHHRY